MESQTVFVLVMLRKSAHSQFWLDLLYRVKGYSNGCPPVLRNDMRHLRILCWFKCAEIMEKAMWLQFHFSFCLWLTKLCAWQ